MFSSKISLSQFFFAIASLAIVGGIMYFCKPVLMPVALSVLLAFALNPVVQVFERWGLGRIMSVVLTTLMATAAIGLVCWLLFTQVRDLAEELPSHKHTIKEKIDTLMVSENSTLGRLKQMAEELFEGTGEPDATELKGELAGGGDIVEGEPEDAKEVVVARAESSPLSAAVAGLLALVTPLAITALVFVLAIFLLLKREDVRDRVLSLVGDESLSGTTRLMQDTTKRVSRYLLNLILVNSLFGIWFGAGLWLLDVPHALLWGLFTALFRFIPFVGSPASVAFPLLMSIASSTGWTQPLLVLVFFSVSEFATANFIEPLLFGKTTGLSPLALLSAALFWGWIWGAIGLVLTTPLTVCLVVLGMHIPALRWLKVMLAEQPPLKARHQYFQRLLAEDDSGARRVFDQFASEHDTLDAFDEVIVPSLLMTRSERAADTIRADEEKRLWKSHQELLVSLEGSAKARDSSGESPPDEPGGFPASESDAPRRDAPLIYGYPVHHQSEELGLVMLRLVIRDATRFALCSTRTLPRKALEEIKSSRPAVVVLAVIQPGGLPQLRNMCRKLGKACPEIPVVVMFLSEIAEYDDFLVSLRELGVDYLTTTLRQTKAQIENILVESGEAVRESASPSTKDPEANADDVQASLTHA